MSIEYDAARCECRGEDGCDGECGTTGGGCTACQSHEPGPESDAHVESSSMPDLGIYWSIEDLDEDWEHEARDHLSDVEFDTELGVELARDAMRLARGEISESTFHKLHHDAIMEEFGIDERKTDPISNLPVDGSQTPSTNEGFTGSPRPKIPGTASNGKASRRGVLKSMSGLAASGTMASLAGCIGGDGPRDGTSASANSAEEGDIQMGMVIDMERCIACLKCVEGCKEENDTDRGTHWMHVFRFNDSEFEEDREGYLPRPCQHCSEPSCAYVCPTHARYKRTDDGIVLTNYDTCIGCKYCQVACPYGVNFLGKGEPTDKSTGFRGGAEDRGGRRVGGPPPDGVMGKCTFCVHRQDDPVESGTTACEDACPVDAIHFGDMNDSESKPRDHLQEKEEASRFNLLDQLGNKPNVVYVGEEPSSSAEPIEGPFTYEDLGLEKFADPEVDGE